MVLFVSQMSFLMSTFKYVCAVFLRLNDLQQEDAAVMGWIMVMLDVVFLLGSVVAVVLIVVLLRASATTLQENKAAVAEDNDGERIAQNRSLVKVVPTPQEDEQQKSNLKKEITALKWQKNIRQALMNNSKPLKALGTLTRVKSRRTRTAEEIQRKHEDHRALAMKNIEQQQTKRRSSLQLRVQARNQKHSDGQEGRGSGVSLSKGGKVSEMVLTQEEAAGAATTSTASVLAANVGTNIETLWLTLCKIMKTPDKFQTWMVQYDKALTGLLLRVRPILRGCKRRHLVEMYFKS